MRTADRERLVRILRVHWWRARGRVHLPARAVPVRKRVREAVGVDAKAKGEEDERAGRALRCGRQPKQAVQAREGVLRDGQYRAGAAPLPRGEGPRRPASVPPDHMRRCGFPTISSALLSSTTALPPRFPSPPIHLFSLYPSSPFPSPPSSSLVYLSSPVLTSLLITPLKLTCSAPPSIPPPPPLEWVLPSDLGSPPSRVRR